MRGMILEGTVTNVAAFGAFVDIGVHQDGLVHVSAMSKTFIKVTREVVKSGDIVKVKVLEIEGCPRAHRTHTAARRRDRHQGCENRRRSDQRREMSGLKADETPIRAAQGARAGRWCAGWSRASGRRKIRTRQDGRLAELALADDLCVRAKDDVPENGRHAEIAILEPVMRQVP